jgi:flagellar motor switch protein FliG
MVEITAPAPGPAGSRKAAVFLVSVDSETAARVLAQLGKDEQERMAFEVARLEAEPPGREESEAVLREFAAQQAGLEQLGQGGLEAARRLLEKVLPGGEARRVFETVQASLRRSPFGFLQKAAPEDLVAFLADEHPQTVALILSHLGPGQAAEILERLEPPRRREVVRRLATLERTSVEVVGQVEKALESKLAAMGTPDLSRAGGLPVVAAILNRVKRSTEREILEGMEEEDAEMAERVRRLMFSFDEILRVDDRGVQNLLRNVDTAQVSLALKTASPELRDKFFRNMSKRASELVREEMEYMGPVRLSDVEASRRAIVDVVRRLEEQGELLIEGRTGAEEVVR